ncbi:MAG: 1-acyl-sn-glycerol-3-phosphate acyltransferase [Bacteroidia bacterium]|nr:1-acyl-sn-glycerol-3-phosphate acyltransferase [Bacteroidia bacterium]
MIGKDQDKAQQLVDIKDVIKEKNPGLYKMLPGFVFWLLKKILHQDDINYILTHFKDYQGVDFLENALKYMKVSYKVTGLDCLSDDNKYVFVANHPLGGLEGMVLAYITGRKFGKIVLPVNDILLYLNNLKPLFIPVNKTASSTREAIKKYSEIYSSDVQIIMFPAGYVSRRSGGLIKDNFWEKSFLKKAIEHKRFIVPVYVKARNSNLFYTIANLRKFLGIKANIEMFLLPHEMFSRSDLPFKIIFGKPVHYDFFSGQFKLADWTDKIRQYVYTLDNIDVKSFEELNKS